MRSMMVLLLAGCSSAPDGPYPPVGAPLPSAAAACSQKGGSVATVPKADILRWLAGTWQLCDGDGMFLSHSAVEFAADGNWWFLDGSLQRSQEFGGGGTYFQGDRADDNHVYLHFNDGRGGAFWPSFKDQPRQLFTGGDGGFDSTYAMFR